MILLQLLGIFCIKSTIYLHWKHVEYILISICFIKYSIQQFTYHIVSEITNICVSELEFRVIRIDLLNLNRSHIQSIYGFFFYETTVTTAEIDI